MEKINEIARKLEDLEEQSSKLEWTQYTVGYDFGCEEVETAQKNIKDIIEL